MRIQTVGGKDSGITIAWKRPADPRMWAMRGPWRCERRELGDGGTLPDTIRSSEARSSAAQAAQWLRIQLYAHHTALGPHQAEALVAWLNDGYVQGLSQHLEAHGLSVTVTIARPAVAHVWHVGPTCLEREITVPVEGGAA
ncbi:hypothetical protein [Streptomyces lydicus]|uniref:hypothetical protein n=1 Tax=Streptomyces lydicus TaxID=47763 RepID=UPI0010126A9C|nr:hypothetical protein [Streptomyces lydicus]MCZ1012233.1 hypothetical protein [Streptomyces lydicus]